MVEYRYHEEPSCGKVSRESNMLGNIQEALKRKNIVWRQHVLARMLERNLSRNDVFNVIQNGEIIEFYPEAKPYPGCLIAGILHNKRVHVVARLG